MAALLVAPTSPVTVGAWEFSPDDGAVLASSADRGDRISQDVQWRQSYHFRADRDYVAWLYDHPAQTVGNNDPGGPRRQPTARSSWR